MKAIIVAAGLGNRLTPLTDDKPKCMLKVGDQTIMERLLGTLRECGVHEIVVVKGYRKEMINYPDIRYYENTDYENNNILRSLFYAESEMDEGFVFSYSDIIFKEGVLEKLLQSEAEISLVIDVDWMQQYQQRNFHPVSEAELVKVNNNRIIEIGKNMTPNEAHGEFIGLAKFTKEGAATLKSNYRSVVSQCGNRSFQQAASVEKAYLTDMIQELIDRGYVISNVDIKGGWIEIDTSEDLEKARRLLP